MKNAIRISVAKPCSEKFENFEQTSAGGFCDSCQKEVIDFTSMTAQQILNHFSSNSGETCGQFKPSQLKTYEPIMNNHTNTNFVSRGIAIMSFSLLSLCAVSNLQAQEIASNQLAGPETSITEQSTILGKTAIVQEQYTVKGIVLDEDNLPLGGVNVVLKGSTEGASTDFEGKFEFPSKLNVNDVLVFSYVGFESKEYTITQSVTNTIDITINFDVYDVELMGEVVVGGATYTTKRNVFQKFIALFR